MAPTQCQVLGTYACISADKQCWFSLQVHQNGKVEFIVLTTSTHNNHMLSRLGKFYSLQKSFCIFFQREERSEKATHTLYSQRGCSDPEMSCIEQILLNN